MQEGRYGAYLYYQLSDGTIWIKIIASNVTFIHKPYSPAKISYRSLDDIKCSYAGHAYTHTDLTKEQVLAYLL